MNTAKLILGAAAFVAVAAIATGAASDTARAQATAEPASAAKHAAAAVSPGDADGAFVKPWSFSEPNGEKLFKRVCAGCHMPDAGGAKGAGFYPALAKNPKLEASGYPVMVVLSGLNGMPRFAEMMTDKQVAEVVNYVRTHFGNRYRDTVTPADVKAARDDGTSAPTR